MNHTDIVADSYYIHDIPVTTSYKKTAFRMPVVIFSHGFTRSKEDFTGELLEYAKRGIYGIALDNRGHGERKEKKFFEVAMEAGGLNILTVRELIDATAKDIPIIIDYLKDEPYVDIERIGVYGVSMGGFTAFRAVTLDDRIKAAAPVIASPVWDEFPKGNGLVDTPELRQRLGEFARKKEPVNLKDKFHNKHILIQIGKDDPHFDPDKVRSFAEDVITHNTVPGRMQLKEYANVAHEVTDEMRATVMEWMTEVL
ncbi:MAG: alpha/beta fold hydrolase [Spirochaetales bacterium]|nr:alpha/beta fold hydrolase [Spirochaetales bacterium]